MLWKIFLFLYLILALGSWWSNYVLPDLNLLFPGKSDLQNMTTELVGALKEM
jgi:hypothetical protein